MTNSDQFESSGPSARNAAKWAVAARALMANGQTETAVKLALQVLNTSTDDPEAAIHALEVLSADVPSWHFRLARDHVRNEAFDAALRRAIRPGMRVLDIGSGTGLLALMAARAGAAQVYSCEMNPAIADAAREIVAANGLSDRVHVLAKRSSELDADADLGGRVDLIVAEIVGDNLLSEGVLATMQHAVECLLKPGGRVIPQKGTIRIALALDPRYGDKRMGVVQGFDLSPFNRLAKPTYSVSSKDMPLQLMSEAVDLFQFDFQSATLVAEARAQRTLTAMAVPVNCVAQWIRLEMDEAGSYENSPGALAFSNWATVVHPLPGRVAVRTGDSVTLNGSHDLSSVRVWAQAGSES